MKKPYDENENDSLEPMEDLDAPEVQLSEEDQDRKDFYQFIHQNDLREEALELLNKHLD